MTYSLPTWLFCENNKRKLILHCKQSHLNPRKQALIHTLSLYLLDQGFEIYAWHKDRHVAQNAQSLDILWADRDSGFLNSSNVRNSEAGWEENFVPTCIIKSDYPHIIRQAISEPEESLLLLDYFGIRKLISEMTGVIPACDIPFFDMRDFDNTEIPTALAPYVLKKSLRIDIRDNIHPEAISAIEDIEEIYQHDDVDKWLNVIKQAKNLKVLHIDNAKDLILHPDAQLEELNIGGSFESAVQFLKHYGKNIKKLTMDLVFHFYDFDPNNWDNTDIAVLEAKNLILPHLEQCIIGCCADEVVHILENATQLKKLSTSKIITSSALKNMPYLEEMIVSEKMTGEMLIETLRNTTALKTLYIARSWNQPLEKLMLEQQQSILPELSLEKWDLGARAIDPNLLYFILQYAKNVKIIDITHCKGLENIAYDVRFDDYRDILLDRACLIEQEKERSKKLLEEFDMISQDEVLPLSHNPIKTGLSWYDSALGKIIRDGEKKELPIPTLHKSPEDTKRTTIRIPLKRLGYAALASAASGLAFYTLGFALGAGICCTMGMLIAVTHVYLTPRRGFVAANSQSEYIKSHCRLEDWKDPICFSANMKKTYNNKQKLSEVKSVSKRRFI